MRTVTVRDVIGREVIAQLVVDPDCGDVFVRLAMPNLTSGFLYTAMSLDAWRELCGLLDTLSGDVS